MNPTIWIIFPNKRLKATPEPLYLFGILLTIKHLLIVNNGTEQKKIKIYKIPKINREDENKKILLTFLKNLFFHIRQYIKDIFLPISFHQI